MRNHAIALLYGKEAQQETFLMTNITPQKPSLNQKLWEHLEEIELETFAPKFKELWIYTRPLFDVKTMQLKSSHRVEIPDAFYKIYWNQRQWRDHNTLFYHSSKC